MVLDQESPVSAQWGIKIAPFLSVQ